MKIDSDKIWMMPLILGPVAPERQNRVGFVYGEVEWIGLQYRTDPDARAAYSGGYSDPSAAWVSGPEN